jgi:eukaryotic-like serine/threonine-protein kinase
MMQLASNLQIGPRIGAGYFGEVYCATDDVHGEVAVKIMRQLPGEPPADWQTRRAGLLAEAQRLSQATHRNVIQVYYVVESDTNDAIHRAYPVDAQGHN